MFKQAYRKIHQAAQHKHATYYLMGISFLEAFCLPLTPLIVFIPMIIAMPQKSWRLVNLATLAASVGSVIGYYIGYQFIQIIYPWLVTIGYADAYQKATELYAKWDVLALFISSVTIIPFKIFTIISGVLHSNFMIFIITVIIVRWLHFASIPIALHWFAKPMMRWIEGNMNKSLSVSALQMWFIVTVEGFVALAAQMLTIRQLMPFVGNSVSVTSLIIGMFLLALAVGYRQGGKIETQATQRLVRNFILAAIWIGLGLSYVFLVYWFLPLQQWTGFSSYVLLMLYLIVVTVPMVYWLGQTVPIVMNLWQTKQRAGDIGGRVLQLSTIGSFLGAVLTSVVIMSHLGLGWTVFITTSLLLLIVLWVSLSGYYMGLISFIVAALLSVFYWLNVQATAHFFVETNNYAQYHVVKNVMIYPHTAQEKTGNILNINQSSSSFLTADHTAFPYLEKIKEIVFDDLNLRHQRILVLGAGGFTFSAQGNYENEITYVDIDPAILETVQKHFLPDAQEEFVVSDARVYVQQDKTHYAAIIVDVFSHQLTIPAHLLTVEFFAALNRILLPEGVAIFNIVADPFLDDPYSQAIDAGLRAVFKSCVSIPIKYEDKASNIVYVCQRNDTLNLSQILQNAQGQYYTDDLNRATWDQQFLKLE